MSRGSPCGSHSRPAFGMSTRSGPRPSGRQEPGNDAFRTAGATLRASVDHRGDPPSRRVCIVGASGKLGTYMVEHALDRGYEVVAVCREQSVPKLAGFADRITIVPGATDDRDVIQ